MLTIEQTMPNLLIDGGIFKTLPQYGDYSPVEAGLDYCLIHSGSKPISRLVEHFLSNDGTLSNVNEATIATAIKNKYKAQWDKAWEVLMESEYNPIANTSRNFTFTDTHSGEDIHTQGKRHGESVNKTFAEINDSGNGNDREKVITDSKFAKDKDKWGHIITHTETGDANIGIMTSQAMINEELELRKQTFYEQMFENIDDMITLPFYGNLSQMSTFKPSDLTLEQTSAGVILRYGDQTVTIHNGTDGTNGVDGQDGRDGVDGQDGRNGTDGRDGQNGLTPILTLEDNGDLYVEYEEVNPNE